MNETDLIRKIYEAFSLAPPPDESEITSHDCCECNEIRSELTQYMRQKIPDSYFKTHSQLVPLLSPKAFRYFLPRIMEFTIQEKLSDLSEFLLYHLGSDEIEGEYRDYWKERISVFSENEKSIIRAYLKYRRKWDEAKFDEEFIARGLEIWV